MGQEKTIASLQGRIASLKESIKPIEEKIKILERTISILETDSPSNVVKNELEIVEYPNSNDAILKFLFAVNHCNRFSSKMELLYAMKGRETPSNYSLLLQSSMRILQKLVRNQKIVMVRYNNSNLLSFYGKEKWIASNEWGEPFILPEYEPNKIHLAKIIKETAEFRGL